ncbi:hypothetical protein SUDANB70_04089 [Streptomyces sp. enrichment culture]
MVTASMSAETRWCCPSRCSVRTFRRPWTTTGSPTEREATAFAASWRLAHTVKKLVCPSVHMPFSRSQYREVTASRNRADGPDARSRYTGDVATLPTAQIIVSFIASPPRPGAARGSGGYAYGPLPYGSVRCAGRASCRGHRESQTAVNGKSPLNAVDTSGTVENPATRASEPGSQRVEAVPTTRTYCSRTSRYRSSSAATGSSTRARPHPAAASRSRLSASCP